MNDQKIKQEWIKWQLQDIASTNPEDIEDNEHDIYGEDEQGRDGCTTIKITDMAQEALDRIKELELDLGLMTLARDQKSALLESCEKALEQRDNAD